MLHRASSLVAVGLLSNIAFAQPTSEPPKAPDAAAGPAAPAVNPSNPDPKIPPMPGPVTPETPPPALEPTSEEPPAPAPPPPPAEPPAKAHEHEPKKARAHHAHHAHHRMKLRTPPPPRPRKRPGVENHDGFYLRFGTGFGIYEESLESDDSDLYGGEVKGNGVGLATVGEFAMGGTIRPGLVFGGGLYTARLVSAHYRDDDSSAGSPPPELDPEARSLFVIGPFLDYYPRPSRGLHFQAALGLAALSAGMGGNDDDDDNYVAGGGALVFGVGYEWWVGDEWSVGVMARAMAAAVTGEDDAGVRWFHGITTNPSLMLTATYH